MKFLHEILNEGLHFCIESLKDQWVGYICCAAWKVSVFWFVFSRIRTEYREFGKRWTRKNSEHGHFSCNVVFIKFLAPTLLWSMEFQKQPPEVFYKKTDVLKNLVKLKGKRLCQSLLFNKLAWGLYLYLKKGILEITFFKEHLRATTSGIWDPLEILSMNLSKFVK